jgi:putative ABC transport system permease protein
MTTLSIHLKTSIRHLSRNRIYAVINIIGLATGITAMLLAILFWRDEESFDDFHKNASSLYRITTTLRPYKDKDFITVGGTGQVQGPAFKAAIPEIKSFTRVMGGDIYSNMIANKKTIKVHPLFVEKNFLEVFSFPLVHGNASTAFKNVESVVLTETIAKKFFNSTDVIGKLLEVDADPSFERLGKPLVVTAVVKDPPPNSSLQFEVLYTFDFMRLSFEDEAWLNAYLGTFLVLEPGSNIKNVKSKMAQVYAVHAKNQVNEKMRNFGYDPQVSYDLQPVSEIHFNSFMRSYGSAEGGVINGGDRSHSIVFLVISGFILMMAAINFININLAGSIKRSREVGIRKIAGGSRWQIIAQFLTEASILCLVSFILSMLLIYILLPVFNQLTGKQLVTAELFSSSVLLYFLLLLTILIAFTSLYPAFIISRFKPAEVLYNRVMRGGSGTLGKVLVIVQFTPAIFLLIATLVYYSQMNFVRTKNLGYNPNQIITTSIYGDRDYGSAIRFLKNEFAKDPVFKMVSFGSSGYTDTWDVNGKGMQFFRKTADENFLPLMEIPLLAGRNFISADADKGIIVNEAFIREAGLEYVPGMQVQLNDYDYRMTRSIVGVVKDYHYASPRLPILPMIIIMKKEPDGDIWVKVDQANMNKAISALERVYKKAMPSALFEYGLMDELNAKDFIQEKRWQKVVTIGTILSFAICWLGLFGLAHLVTYQRIKEIGIRKVLGASLTQIVVLLTGKFVRLVLVAIVIASPLAWMAMNYWLRGYAYHINIGPGVFLISATIAISVTFISVSYQSFRSALMNPVKSLRTE